MRRKCDRGDALSSCVAKADVGPKPVGVSFLIVSYNQKDFIEEALVSALSQDYPQMQIVVSDDCSSDGTWAVIQKIATEYAGRHHLVLNRTDKNLGLAENFNQGICLCSGELIVVQGGDDISESNRVTKLVKLWLKNDRNPDLLFSNISWIDVSGNIYKIDRHKHAVPSLREIKKGKHYIAGGMAAAYTSRLFKKFGLISPNVRTEDYVLTFRAIISGGVVFEESPLVRYRRHENSEMVMRAAVTCDYQKEKQYSIAAVAEAEDRVRSWILSGRKDFLFMVRLKRKLLGTIISNQSFTGTFLQRLKCALLAAFLIKPNLLIRILRKDLFCAVKYKKVR